MKLQNNLATDSKLLRKKAEELLGKKQSKSTSLLSASETQKLIHELQVHQIELELQNEELGQAISVAQDAIDLYDFAPTGYLTLSRDGEILNLNHCAAKMLGNQRQYLINRRLSVYISDDTRPTFNLFFDKLFSSQSTENCEVTLSPSGNLPIFIQLSGITSGPGKHCLVTAIDITERKKAEETIRESEKKFRIVIEEAVDVVITVNMEGYLTYVNPAGEKRSGYSADELKKMKFYDLVEPDYKQRVKRHFFKQYIERRAFSTTKYPIRTKSGELKWVNQIAQLIIEKNEVKGFHAIIRDVSELHEAEKALQKSEEKYRLIVENIGEGFGFVNAEEQFLLANKSAEVIFGVEPGGLVNKNLNQFVSKDQFSIVQEETERRSQGIQSIYELDILRPDNEKRTISVTAVPQNDKEGIFIGTYGLFRDITESKQMKEALLEGELQYRELIENSPDAIVIDIDGIIVYVNNECSRLMAASSTEELIGKSIIHFVHPDYHEFVSERMRTAANGGTILPLVEEKFIRLDGSIVDVEVKAFPIQFGNRRATQSIVRDISERKLAEETLRSSQQLIEGIINTIPVRIFWKDRNSVYLGCNKIFANDAGFSDPKDLIGKDDFQMGWRDQAELYRSGDGQVMESGNPILLNEEPQTTPEGNTIILLTNKIPLKNSTGEINGILGTSMDITERINVVQEIKHKNEQLQSLNNEKDKFFSIIAHDLRSPFNSFLGLTELMAEELPTLTMAQIQDLAISMKKSATNLYSLLENLLKWSLMQQGLISFAPELVQLKTMADECLASVLDPAKNKEIELIIDIPEGLAVFADQNMIQTIIRNLVSNALKFTSKGGKVSLSARISNDKSVEVSVKDSGIGMSQSMVDNLFRIDVKTNRPGTEGEPSSGLGLLLCKEFVEKHGGKIWVESEVGKGSLFTFTILCKYQIGGIYGRSE